MLIFIAFHNDDMISWKTSCNVFIIIDFLKYLYKKFLISRTSQLQ